MATFDVRSHISGQMENGVDDRLIRLVANGTEIVQDIFGIQFSN